MILVECNGISQISNKRIVIPWSGGLDSTALIPLIMCDYSCEVFPLFINRGQGNYEEEKKAVKYYNTQFTSHYSLKYSNVVEIEVPIPPQKFREMMSECISHKLRNSDIINQAVRYALYIGAEIVAVGSLTTDQIWKDGTEQYFQSKTNEVRLGTGNMDLCIISPYLLLGFDKDDVVTWCNKNSVELQYTRSCFRKGELHCGTCDACKNRKEAFRLASVKDETIYA